jgi:UrcA family protein
MTRFVARMTAALALAGAVISSPAYARIDSDAKSVTVKTADLNLSAEAGRAVLTRRIKHAAEIVCGRAYPADVRATMETRACRTDAVANAMPQVQLALAKTARGERLAANAISVTARAL